jgi:hypothetical protein
MSSPANWRPGEVGPKKGTQFYKKPSGNFAGLVGVDQLTHRPRIHPLQWAENHGRPWGGFSGLAGVGGLAGPSEQVRIR